MKCLQCKKNFSQRNDKHLPFCSSRCKSLDLSGWLSESNKISDYAEYDHEDF